MNTKVKIRHVGNTNMYGFEFEESCFVLPMNHKCDHYEVYEFMGVKGFTIKTRYGLMHTDFGDTGWYTLYLVEDTEGNMLHVN